MLQRRYQASFLLCVGIVAAVLLCGCGARAAHGQQQQAAVTATATVPTCTGSAASWAYTDSLAQLKHKAVVIVVGTVVNTQGRQDSLCSIHTDATVRVDRIVYDPLHQVTGATLVVTTKGGVLASGYGQGVEDEAQLGVGDQLVLFLVAYTKPNYGVVDGEQGAPHIINGMVQSLSSGTMPLDAYIAQIEQA